MTNPNEIPTTQATVERVERDSEPNLPPRWIVAHRASKLHPWHCRFVCDEKVARAEAAYVVDHDGLDAFLIDTRPDPPAPESRGEGVDLTPLRDAAERLDREGIHSHADAVRAVISRLAAKPAAQEAPEVEAALSDLREVAALLATPYINQPTLAARVSSDEMTILAFLAQPSARAPHDRGTGGSR